MRILVGSDAAFDEPSGAAALAERAIVAASWLAGWYPGVPALQDDFVRRAEARARASLPRWCSSAGPPPLPGGRRPVGIQAVAFLDRLHRTVVRGPNALSAVTVYPAAASRCWAVRTSVPRDPVFSSGHDFAAAWMMAPDLLTPPHPLTRQSAEKALPPRPAVGAGDGRIQRPGCDRS
ncbi:hypothetical protein [Streptomyces sp. Ncost-T10-10d]|uniref:hypothetical protein n=1 Tax=Streptomyces sp. Ncost-T10-10d TaxID=1839774 RepID=UPI00159F03DC|nr:hypothetical protein [Streptomyces sp. Ncost-T10-10d]